MTHRTLAFPLILLAFVLAAVPASAVDGVILIDQNRAMAGGVTPGDTPGFPITISTSGSFRLSGHLSVPDVNTTAIAILGTAESVTIDLNGFSIVGPVTCTIGPTVTCAGAADDPNNVFGPGDGILSEASVSLMVSNGTISGMGRYGLFVTGGANSIIENVQARENGLGGLWSSGGIVLNSIAWGNGGDGISAINGGMIKGTVVTFNRGTGISSPGGVDLNIQDCQIRFSGGFGISMLSGLVGNSAISGNQGGAISGPFITKIGNYCSGTGC